MNIASKGLEYIFKAFAFAPLCPLHSPSLPLCPLCSPLLPFTPFAPFTACLGNSTGFKALVEDSRPDSRPDSRQPRILKSSLESSNIASKGLEYIFKAFAFAPLCPLHSPSLPLCPLCSPLLPFTPFAPFTACLGNSTGFKALVEDSRPDSRPDSRQPRILKSSLESSNIASKGLEYIFKAFAFAPLCSPLPPSLPFAPLHSPLLPYP